MDKKVLDVRRTMKIAGQPTQDYPKVPEKSVMETGLRLEFEELLEKAMGMGMLDTFANVQYEQMKKLRDELFEQGKTEHLKLDVMPPMKFFGFKDSDKPCLKEIFDATEDQQVVLNWTTNAMGMHGIVDKGWDRVDTNNLTKFPVNPSIELVETTIKKYAEQGQEVFAEQVNYEGITYTVFKNTKGKYLKPVGFVGVELGDILDQAIEAGQQAEKQSK